jgi:hypothetical protein
MLSLLGGPRIVGRRVSCVVVPYECCLCCVKHFRLSPYSEPRVVFRQLGNNSAVILSLITEHFCRILSLCGSFSLYNLL